LCKTQGKAAYNTPKMEGPLFGPAYAGALSTGLPLFLFMCSFLNYFLNIYCYVSVPKQNGFVEDDLNYNFFSLVLILFSDSKSPGDAKYLEAFGKR
jgi:hypothetical protein